MGVRGAGEKEGEKRGGEGEKGERDNADGFVYFSEQPMGSMTGQQVWKKSAISYELHEHVSD